MAVVQGSGFRQKECLFWVKYIYCYPTFHFISDQICSKILLQICDDPSLILVKAN